ncbi:hypothetical protein F5Y10DRAFT_265810 [Nemania abortiva]|nr:hypothetical protein F5Y10DRAFT_265810 [Nemania abortiva]
MSLVNSQHIKPSTITTHIQSLIVLVLRHYCKNPHSKYNTESLRLVYTPLEDQNMTPTYNNRPREATETGDTRRNRVMALLERDSFADKDGREDPKEEQEPRIGSNTGNWNATRGNFNDVKMSVEASMTPVLIAILVAYFVYVASQKYFGK